MKTIYKILNFLFKASIVLVLTVLPIIWYCSLGFDHRKYWWILVNYHVLVGVIPALVFNLGESIKRYFYGSE